MVKLVIKKSKKGASQIMVIVLLIVLAAISVLSISSIIKNQNVEKIQTKFNCISDVKIEILDACYTDNLFNITIKNKHSVILGDFFLVRLFFDTKNSNTIPSPPEIYIGPYETKTFIFPHGEDLSSLNKIQVIPKIEDQSYLCMENAPEFIIKEC